MPPLLQLNFGIPFTFKAPSVAAVIRIIALFDRAANLVQVNVGSLGRLVLQDLGGVPPALDNAPSGRDVCDMHNNPRLARRHAVGTSGQQSHRGRQQTVQMTH